MIKKIEHVGIRVRDLQKSLAFYSNVLGFMVRGQMENKETGLKLAFLRVGDSEIELLQYPDQGPEPLPSGVIAHIAFRVDAIEDVLSRLMDEGVELRDQGPREIFGDTKIAFFYGPDGELLELYEK
jgi:lactoylglutathione lyase